MTKHTMLFGLMTFTANTHAACLDNPPELGDTGPDSELVCREMEQSYAGSTLAVAGRTVHSGESVSVHVIVDGVPATRNYRLSGVSWRVTELQGAIPD